MVDGRQGINELCYPATCYLFFTSKILVNDHFFNSARAFGKHLDQV